MGLLLLEIGDQVDGIRDQDKLDIEVEEGVINNVTQGTVIRFQPIPSFMQELLQGGGLIEYVKRQKSA
jgi:3-isopropylmalate/(R)-2-methylmalate dehydratase small subunit